MNKEVHPLRVCLKAIFLFVVLNVMFALVNPPVGKLTLYNFLFPGRLRFPYEGKPLPPVRYSVSVLDDFDALFGAHVISAKKSANEFRIILLGDSTTWGYGVPPDDTLSEQINRLNMQSCDGRSVRIYNLSYPFSFPTRDLLILDKALEYQPDMFIWLITLSTLEPKVAERQFIVPHAEQYLQLAESYDLHLSHFSPPIEEPSFWDRTIIGQRKHLKNIVLLQVFGILWGGTQIDDYDSLQPEPNLPNPDVPANVEYEERFPEEASSLLDSLMTDVIAAGIKRAGNVPVVLVNEPIFVAQGQNHLIRYNAFYPRWAFDEYRQFVSTWTQQQNYIWLDYWDAIPPEDFSDAYFHRRVAGEKHFSELLASDIRNLTCP